MGNIRSRRPARRELRKASLYLRDRARQEGAFNWTIIFELDHIGSPAFRSLLHLITVLDQLVMEKPDRRTVKIVWVIKPGEESMRSMAYEMVRHCEGMRKSDGRTKGVNIEIASEPPSQTPRR